MVIKAMEGMGAEEVAQRPTGKRVRGAVRPDGEATPGAGRGPCGACPLPRGHLIGAAVAGLLFGLMWRR